jgi:hypothetical protein
MGSDNLPLVQVWATETVSFSLGPIKQSNPLPLGATNLDPYLSFWGFCRDWLGSPVPISGSAFQVVLSMVASRYSTVN